MSFICQGGILAFGFNILSSTFRYRIVCSDQNQCAFVSWFKVIYCFIFAFVCWSFSHVTVGKAQMEVFITLPPFSSSSLLRHLSVAVTLIMLSAASVLFLLQERFITLRRRNCANFLNCKSKTPWMWKLNLWSCSEKRFKSVADLNLLKAPVSNQTWCNPFLMTFCFLTLVPFGLSPLIIWNPSWEWR